MPLHRDAEALLIPYGPSGGEGGASGELLMVGAFEAVGIEYASIRRGCGIFDQPNRATLVVRGGDRIEFLNRMLTQELSPKKGFVEFCARDSFWLSRKGRIDADLQVMNLPERVVLDVDAHALARAKSGLESYVITEDVVIADESEQWHRIALHGPASAAIVAGAGEHVAGSRVDGIGVGEVGVVRIAGAETIIERRDSLGEIGLELLVPIEHAVRVYEALATREGTRRIGWHAINIARIEAGTAQYYLDFGPDSLPHETGVLRDRVSFTKGCYLGQEVVARMESLGHPKQRLVALEIDARGDSPQSETGTAVLASDSDDGAVVGAVTSSCVSPMLGDRPIALAMMKWSHSMLGTKVWLSVAGARIGAAVRENLRFLKS